MADSAAQGSVAGDGPRECDVAVVFVHGIGDQAQGTTLLSWSEPLQELLVHSGRSHGFATRVVSSKDLHGDGAEVILEVTRDDGRQASWLLTEARWADDFHPSSASDVLSWAAKFTGRAARRGLVALAGLLWFVIRHQVVPTVRRLFPRETGCIGLLVTPLVWAVMLLLYWVLLYALVAPYVLLAVALFVGAPVLAVVAVAALGLLLVLQRVPVLGGRVKPLVADLVTSIGDAQAYRERAIQAAAMREQVLKRVTEARARAKRVVVVAHSQGAAISCRAFLEGLAPWPDHLVTVGAGTTLLNDGRSVDQWRSMGCPHWVNVWTSFDLVPAGPLGDSPAQVRDRLVETVWHHTSDGGFEATSAAGLRRLRWTPGRGPECWAGSDDLVEQARMSRGYTISKTAVAIPGTEPVTVPLERREATLIAASLLGFPRGERLVWVDTPLPREFGAPGPEESPVANRNSFLSDHTTYPQNLTQVQQPLARLLLDLSEQTAGALPPNSERAEESHVVRVRALAMSRLVAAVTAAATVGLLVEREVNAPLSKFVNWAADHWSFGWIVAWLGTGVGASIVLAVLGVAVYAALSGLMGAAWRSWHHTESLRLCADADGPRFRPGFTGSVFGLVYVFALGFSFIWLGSHFTDTLSYLELLVALLVPTYLLWAVFWPFHGLRPSRLPARS
ncbi:hypothetical protein [Catellatospora tritici]|uniref:hypothetical protein n=1 Tax=Catellatospora tritici TaxID=2851566 RepID=UPI001C2DCC2D|nr:hypothetical protein [Catellatospora tritici]MBV1853143.1 hypothetical protein [Catellatospora tritici]